MTSQAGRQLRVAYLISQYPSASHVFIKREIAGLRALGAHVEVFTVRPVPPELLLETMRSEAATTTVIQDKAAVARDVLEQVRREPVAFSKVLWAALRTGQPTARSRSWQAFYLAEAVRLSTQMRLRGLRHVHVHFANNGADIARLAVELGRATDGAESAWSWSFTMHGPTEFEAVGHYDLAAKVHDADGVACITDFARSQLMRLVPAADWPKLRIVAMSVDLDLYHPPEQPRGSQAPLRLLSVGRLVPEKAWPVLIEAVADVVSRGVDVHLSVVGAGELHRSLLSQVSALALSERVELLGSIGQDRLPALYREADVFCLPSFQEGLPVVLMEAMATELPVITTAIAGVPELVEDGVTGRLVTPGRADLLAEAIISVAGDRAGRQRMARAGRTVVSQRHDVRLTAKTQRDFLASITSSGSGSPTG